MERYDVAMLFPDKGRSIIELYFYTIRDKRQKGKNRNGRRYR